MPDIMRAAAIEDNHLAIVERPIPKPAENEVLIEVQYAGLNRADLFQLQGSYAPPPGAPQDIPGLEVSGTIVALGDSVTGWKVGDEACALLSGGGYAQYVTCNAAHTLPVPTSISIKDAAALPECVSTVWMTLFDEAKVQHGQSVLVHGGTSGIGTTAIQMLKAHGCDVIITAGNDKKCEFCARLGAKVINYNEQDFVIQVKALTNGKGVDVVLDMVGGDYMQRNLKCLRYGGHLVSIAFLKGAKAELSMGSLLLKNLRWSGVTLRGRSDEQKAGYINNIKENIWPWVESGQLSPVIDRVFLLEEAEKALGHMEECLHIGKILLQMRD